MILSDMHCLIICRVIVITVLLFPMAATAQIGRELISSKYLRVMPGVTTRSDVEEMFGRPRDADADLHIVNYHYATEFMTVTYSYGKDCSNGAEWTVPEWVVQKVSYGPRDVAADVVLPLESVILKKSAFKKQRAGDVTSHVKYVNDAAGISVFYDKTEKSVADIIIWPTREQKNVLACKSP
jgi:hypothetical protein